MSINACDLDQPLTEHFITQAMAAGHIAAGRYTKNLTRDEIALCAKHGFKLWIISEGMGDRATFAGGFDRGNADGHRDAVRMSVLDIPKGVVVYVAVDYAADYKNDAANIGNYLSGYAASQPYNRIGLYADGVIASNVPTPVGCYVPGATGWPGTRDYLRAGRNIAIIQHPAQNLFGVDTDPCEVLDESVLWDPSKKMPASGSVVIPPPASGATPVKAPPVNPMPDLKEAQDFLGVPNDGIWGPRTAAAFAKYYTAR